jgi:CHAD domain-containing protein
VAFELRRGEPLRRAIKRMARAELEDARQAWTNRGRPLADRVHGLRTATKKVRALARLVRPVTGRPARRADRRLGKLARAVSRLRDAEVVLRAFEDLIGGNPRGQSESLQAARAKLGKQLCEQARTFETARRRNEVADRLRREQRGVKRWAPDGGGWSLLGAGLCAGYRRAREAMRRALDDPSGVTFHAWRRAVKAHRFQVRALVPLWPAELEARVDQLEGLGDLLGREHDLTVLAETLVAERRCFADDRECSRLLASVEKRRRELRAESRPVGARLFAERPRAFRRRVHDYFRAFITEPPGTAAAALNGEAPAD